MNCHEEVFEANFHRWVWVPGCAKKKPRPPVSMSGLLETFLLTSSQQINSRNQMSNPEITICRMRLFFRTNFGGSMFCLCFSSQVVRTDATSHSSTRGQHWIRGAGLFFCTTRSRQNRGSGLNQPAVQCYLVSKNAHCSLLHWCPYLSRTDLLDQNNFKYAPIRGLFRAPRLWASAEVCPHWDSCPSSVQAALQSAFQAALQAALNYAGKMQAALEYLLFHVMPYCLHCNVKTLQSGAVLAWYKIKFGSMLHYNIVNHFLQIFLLDFYRLPVEAGQ